MGGINCPPLTGQVSGTYVQDLAGYCGPFFQGIADFFSANAKIEEGITWQDPNVLPAVCNKLSNAKSLLEITRLKFGTFISLHQAEVAPDFDPDKFIESLGTAITDLGNAIFEIDVSVQGPDIQASIWASGLTRAMTTTVESIGKVLEQQIAFANAGQLLTIT